MRLHARDGKAAGWVHLHLLFALLRLEVKEEEDARA